VHKDLQYHHRLLPYGVLLSQPPTNCIYLLTTQLQLTMSKSGSDPFNYQEHLDDEDELDALHQAKRRKEAILYASAIATVAAASIPFGVLASAHQGRVPGAKMVKRQRLAVEDYCQTSCDKHFRRRYRMGKKASGTSSILLGIISPALAKIERMDVFPMDRFLKEPI
jgi:hypothetical protein